MGALDPMSVAMTKLIAAHSSLHMIYNTPTSHIQKKERGPADPLRQRIGTSGSCGGASSQTVGQILEQEIRRAELLASVAGVL